jgi:hypothetical protein
MCEDSLRFKHLNSFHRVAQQTEIALTCQTRLVPKCPHVYNPNMSIMPSTRNTSTCRDVSLVHRKYIHSSEASRILVPIKGLPTSDRARSYDDKTRPNTFRSAEPKKGRRSFNSIRVVVYVCVFSCLPRVHVSPY